VVALALVAAPPDCAMIGGDYGDAFDDEVEDCFEPIVNKQITVIWFVQDV
jgi:hypothetical protein